MTLEHPGKAVPTLGYPSMGDAIRALWAGGMGTHDIAFVTGCPLASVYRTISAHKAKRSIKTQPIRRPAPEPIHGRNGDLWSMPAYDRAKAQHARTVKAARAARQAE